MALFLLLALSGQALAAQDRFEQRAYAPGRIIVKFRASAGGETRERLRSGLDATLLRRIRSLDMEVWKLPPGTSVGSALSVVKSHPGVEYAEPDYLFEPQAVPDDRFFELQWYLENTGRSVRGGNAAFGADIAASEAWNETRGQPGIVIGVVDSGIAYNHPDLRGNIWTNADEVPDNGVDDDANGYVDDVRGWDFVNRDAEPLDYSRDLQGDGHGTHVAGLIGARGDNGRGTAGVMWSCSLMPLQVFDLFQQGTFRSGVILASRIAEAIVYAAQNGCRVINCSFGGSAFSLAVRSSIELAGREGALVIAAAGNDGGDNDARPVYPASYSLDNVVAVAATDENDRLAAYSNFGRSSVDLAAPGGSARGTVYNTLPPERVVLFSDGFESGIDQWRLTSRFQDWALENDPDFGSTVLRSQPAASYSNNELSVAETRDPIPTQGFRGLHLQFLLEYELEPDRDFLSVQVSGDGSAYTRLANATGTSEGIVLFLAWEDAIEAPQLFLRFVLSTDGSDTREGVAVDEVAVTGVEPEFDGDEYGYKSGTSMAAPLVSGTAGLLWSLRPGAGPSEIRRMLLDSAEPVGSLQGKVATGGRLDAGAAVGGAGDGGGSGGGGGCSLDPHGGPETLLPLMLLVAALRLLARWRP
jgi:subtilisin family serine protease